MDETTSFWQLTPDTSITTQLGENGLLLTFVLVACVVVIHFGSRLVLAWFERNMHRTENIWDDALILAMKRPLSALIWVVGLSWIAQVTYTENELPLLSAITPLREVLVLVVLVWFVNGFISEAEKGLLNTAAKEQGADESTVHAVSRLLRTAVVITGALMVMQSLGFDVTGVVALGSIGGLAVSFAARDLLANFFGGLMVYLDRPFTVGDWVRSPDRNIEGTVESIGWRTTRIRTFDQRPLYVPNSIFTTIAVENPSRMRNRRIYETIGVRYDDMLVVRQVVSDVKEMLVAHPEIDCERTLIVNFNSFSDSSLEFFVYTFTKTTDWIRYHEIKQDVLLSIGDIVAQHGAEMAYPTTTVIMAPPAEELPDIEL